MRASLEISQSGDQIGTPHYMSPEQIDPALGEVDERSDVFSLGAALYEALARAATSVTISEGEKRSLTLTIAQVSR